MRVLILEPFWTGSHGDFVEGFVRHTRHETRVLALPGNFWKWRLRAGAHVLGERARRLGWRYDAVFTSSMLNAADLRAYLRPRGVPIVTYFHENQLSYPLPKGREPDPQWAFVHLGAAVASDRVLFNSRFHRDAFFRALGAQVAAVPSLPPRRAVRRLRARARVLPLGVDFARIDAHAPRRALPPGPPVVLWNHRWEFDKAPGDFFAALAAAEARGAEFRLAVLGRNVHFRPKPFERARERFAGRIVRFGYAPSKAVYDRWLHHADLVVSTARQENFGLAVVEAMGAGAAPLLPRRLSYPEIVPSALHGRLLYDDREGLVRRLCALLDAPDEIARLRARVVRAARRFAWPRLIARYDRALEEAAAAP